MVEPKYLPYPYPGNYNNLLKKWLSVHPWVKIGKYVKFPLETKILGTPLDIKTGTIINGPMVVKGSAYVSIGKYCSIAENLYIISSNHRMDRADLQGEFTVPSDINKGPVYIGNNVWIGDNVMILPGVQIGDGSIIGAGSVVTRNIPSFSLAVGCPARVVRERFSNNVKKNLINLGWWHWDHQVIINNRTFFAEDLTDTNWPSIIGQLRLTNDREVNSIDFKGSDSKNYLLDGWDHQEEGRWVVQKEAGFVFKTHFPDKFTKLYLYGHSLYQPQKISLTVNGKNCGSTVISNNWQEKIIPVKGLKQNVNTIRIHLSKSFIPASLDKNSRDLRNLFCKFRSIKLIS